MISLRRNAADLFSFFSILRSSQRAVAIPGTNVSLICLASAADGRLPHLNGASHERHSDPVRSILARRAHAAHGTRAGDRYVA